jgi:hypothetical protein
VSIALNIAAFAPMPIANVSTATIVNIGALRNVRSAKRASWSSVSSVSRTDARRASSW